jgi:hypothetical protein
MPKSWRINRKNLEDTSRLINPTVPERVTYRKSKIPPKNSDFAVYDYQVILPYRVLK